LPWHDGEDGTLRQLLRGGFKNAKNQKKGSGRKTAWAKGRPDKKVQRGRGGNNGMDGGFGGFQKRLKNP